MELRSTLVFMFMFHVTVIWLSPVDCALDTSSIRQQVDFLADDILGTSKYQAYIDRDVSYTPTTTDAQAVLDKLSTDLSKKVGDRVNAITSLRDKLQAAFNNFPSSPSFQDCCSCCAKGNNQNDAFLKFHSEDIDISSLCHTGQGTKSSSGHYPNQAVLDVMKKNLEDNPNLKWQYYGGEDGIMSIYPGNKACDSQFDPRYRPWYSHTAFPSPKDVVVVLDKSGSMQNYDSGRSLMDIAKEAANTVIDSLNQDDRIGVVFFSTVAETRTSDCHGSEFAIATSENKKLLTNYVNSENANGQTYYGRGIEKAFNFWTSTTDPQYDLRKRVKVILFLTDGQPTDRNYLDVIRTKNAALNNSVVILTFSFGNGIGTGAQNILKDIANQINFDPSAGNVARGRFVHVLNPNNLRYQMARYYDFFSQNDNNQAVTVSIPYLDAFGLGLITSICLPVHAGGNFRGVTCIDVTLSDLFSDVTFFSRSAESYAFITDDQTRLLIHPLVPRPTDVYDHPVALRVKNLEVEPEMDNIIYQMQRGIQGTATFRSRRVLSRGDSTHDGVDTIRLNSIYIWKNLGLAQLTVCVVLAVSDNITQISTQREIDGFPYHRLDLSNNPNKCRYINRQGIIDSSTIKFAPFAFSSPDYYLETTETTTTIDRYREYFTGTNEAPFQPDMKVAVGISQEFDSVISKTDSAWQSSVWRYLGLREGVFRLYPGAKLPKKYDHTVRPWYKRATSQKTLITFSKPYVDAFGSGIVITLSKAVFESKTRTHTVSDIAAGVMGMDFTMDLFNSFFSQYIKECKSDKCFIIDNGGYIIAHPDFEGVHEDDIKNIEYIHISQKEETIARALVDKNVMRKDGCINYDKRQIQTFWRITRDTYTEGSDFELSRITGTNAYVIHVMKDGPYNDGCKCRIDRGSEIPECSVGECQCPCYNRKDLQFDLCTGKFIFDAETGLLPPCAPPTPSVNLTSVAKEESKAIESLSYCYPVQTVCPSRGKQLNCSATAGCRWCNNQCGVRSIKVCEEPVNIVAIVVPVVCVVVLVVVVAVVCYMCNKKSASKRRTTSPSAPTAQGVDNLAMAYPQAYPQSQPAVSQQSGQPYPHAQPYPATETYPPTVAYQPPARTKMYETPGAEYPPPAAAVPEPPPAYAEAYKDPVYNAPK